MNDHEEDLRKDIIIHQDSIILKIGQYYCTKRWIDMSTHTESCIASPPSTYAEIILIFNNLRKAACLE